MPLSDMRAFFRWLDQASDEEIVKRQSKAIEMIETQLHSEDAKKNAKYLLSLIEQEMISRNLTR